MHTKSRRFRLIASVALGSLLPSASVTAQLANASAATLGLAGNATAIARGFGAISVNPAGLGMPGAGFSLAVAPFSVRQGLGPVTLSDLKDVQGTLVPNATKEDWLARVAARGSQTGQVGVEVSEFALSMGHLGFQLSTVAGASMNLTPDMVEAMLFGNAGRNGAPVDLSLVGSNLRAFGVTTAGLSYGRPVSSALGEMALGVTLKYSVGHVVAAGRDEGGSTQSDPVRVDLAFPLVTFDQDGGGFNNGSGIGADLGFQMKAGRVSLGAAILNAFNTFGWNEEKLVYRPGTTILEEGRTATDFEKQPLASAPAEVRQTLEDMRFDPTISVGAAYDIDEDFTVSADVRNRFGDGMSLTPKLHAGVGAEYRGLSALDLRGGAAMISGGVQVSGGASLILGRVNLSFAGAVQRGDMEDATIAQFSLSWGGR
ncbi:MAG TPA: DUF5723 family protein [Longimicrobiales bacterium]|nr:DUF5723 family protein [Longimicrobiales bacterium]